MLNYIVNNQIYYLFLQYYCIFFTIYILLKLGKDNGRKYFLLSGILSIFCMLLYIWVNILATGFLWLSAVFLIFYFTKEVNSSILFSSIAILIGIFANYLLDIILSFFFSNNNFNLWFYVVSGPTVSILLAVGIKSVYIRFSSENTITEKAKWVGAILASVTFITYFIIIVIERFTKQETSMDQANSFFIIGYGLISSFVFLLVMYSFQKEYAAKEKQTELSYLKEYTDKLEANYIEMRRFRHDYQNILLSLEEYIVAEDIKGLNTYFYSEIKRASIVIDKNNFKLSQLGNVKVSEVKSLLASKLTVAQEKDIDTEIEVNEPVEKIVVDPILLIRSLGIILDNAIEAAERIENSFIRVAIFKRDKKIVIITANSCEQNIPKLFKLKQEGFSTKGEKRGMGLSNLEQMITKEKRVILETKIDQGIFSQILSIEE